MTNKNNILILKHNDSDYLSKVMKNRGYKVVAMYRGKSLILRIIRRIWFKLKLPFYSVWFNKNILKFDVKSIIIFDSLLFEGLISWLNKKKEINIHVWYWNIVKNTLNPNKLKNMKCTLWTFSELDAKKYHMKFNPPFFFKEIQFDIREEKYDILFIGKDKGRLTKLLDYQRLFESMGLKTKFIITATKNYQKNKFYSKPIPYEETFRISEETKAIFDYIEVNNSGQSMRMMEALFHRKKIITNNILIKEYDFYNENNIFILDVDNIDDLVNFVNTSYVLIDKKIVEKYDFDNFINNFFLED